MVRKRRVGVQKAYWVKASTNTRSNSDLQLPIAGAFDSSSSRWDHGDPWGRERGPLWQRLPWTSALEPSVWQKDCCDVNLNNYPLLVSSTACKLAKQIFKKQVKWDCCQKVDWTVRLLLRFTSFDPHPTLVQLLPGGMFHLEHMQQPSTNKLIAGHISLLHWGAALQSGSTLSKIWEELHLHQG